MDCIAEEDRPKDEAPEVINFKEEVIGYIEDELAQGYGLDQIRKELLEEGYPKEVISFAIDYVEEHNKVSDRVKKKEIPKTDQHHHARRFHLPVFLIVILIGSLIGIFFVFGIGSEEKAAPTRIDIDLYDNLGLRPGVQEIIGSEQLFVKDYIVEKNRADTLLKQSSGNTLLSGLEFSAAVNGFQKRVTSFSISGDGAQTKTLVELRFQASRAVDTLKIVESLQGSGIVPSDVELTAGGVASENFILFTFNNVDAGTALKAVYVLDKEIDSLETLSFAAEEKEPAPRSFVVKRCGDGDCVIGENYRTCCSDCGCPPGFLCSNNVCGAAEIDSCYADAECDDGEVSTKDLCSGRPKTCSNLPITDCVPGDSYCPTGCFYDPDTDCEEVVVEEVEEVDIGSLDITGEQESPDIQEMAITPEEVMIGEELFVEAIVVDANGKDDIERVWFEVLELAQTHGEVADMIDTGREPDVDPDDDIYTGSRIIGEHYLTGYYHITVFAQDRAGNKKKMQHTFRVVTPEMLAEEAQEEVNETA